MHRVGLPKVAIIPIESTSDHIKKLSDNKYKRVVVYDNGSYNAVLIAYKDFNDIFYQAKKLNAPFIYTLDEQRFIHFIDLNRGKRRPKLENKMVIQSNNKHSDFFIYDINAKTYWSLR